jgi:hypothetical protein
MEFEIINGYIYMYDKQKLEFLCILINHTSS